MEKKACECAKSATVSVVVRVWSSFFGATWSRELRDAARAHGTKNFCRYRIDIVFNFPDKHADTPTT